MESLRVKKIILKIVMKNLNFINIFAIFSAAWVKFFSNAGIPSPTNATYAHIFVENRIQLDMLSELNNENLREVEKKFET